ncbi:related to novobiocin biosynthesis protein novR [Saccharomycodes ludwigii]|uniref:Related to novobiocin biosynthesis protein novR n=1 Tax=Saccharomycodes ludwigii TaxID=36035 RepID=A0A376B6X4_9ASCO|nr:hypothetical protein SCDLUD_000905 [Saccharomycodes ludwigii]KAH3903280.1 hypothetical protein SCDLUD_000905 [Saccharomycodes ludwigii]SSD60445.1 related to novobiocin biosynthesis protein novR [Saccharomycodes ludwigii]
MSTITTTASSDSKLETVGTITNNRGYHLSTQGIHNLATGNVEYENKKPIYKTKEEERRATLEHMAGVFRVFGRRGFNEGAAGHISVRDPIDRSTFWINPLGRHFSLICVSDLVHVDEHGNILPDGNTNCVINTAGLKIHSQLHKARPDVNAACHTHSIYGKAWSTFGRELDMLNQDVCMFYKKHSVYKDFGGVVLEEEEGRKLAKALGPENKAVILQNHGLLTVGETIDEAGYLFTLMERCCEVQLLVESTGLPKKIIGDEEAYYTYFNTSDPETLYTEFQPEYQLELKLTNGDFLK